MLGERKAAGFIEGWWMLVGTFGDYRWRWFPPIPLIRGGDAGFYERLMAGSACSAGPAGDSRIAADGVARRR